MTTLDPRVRAGWDALNGPLEGDDITTLYLDTRGLPTVATGVLVASIAAMQALAWLRADGSLATPEEKAAEWERAHAMRPALIWTAYRSPAGLHLPHDEIVRIVLERLDADVELLATRWPGIPSWPYQAQAGLAALAWACGAGSQPPGVCSAAEWPRLHAALDAGDWRGAAAAGQLTWANNPGVRPRDMAVSALFLLASGATWDEARAGWPAGPSAEVAARALAGLGLPEASAGAGRSSRGEEVGHGGEAVGARPPEAVGDGADAGLDVGQRLDGVGDVDAVGALEGGAVGSGVGHAPDSAPAPPAAQEDGADVDETPTPVTHGETA